MNKHITQSERIRKMVIAAMLGAIVAVLTFTPIGMIPLPPPLLSATTVHIPVLLAALVEGPVVGAFVGLVFGLCSFLRSVQGPVGLTVFFVDPRVSILPRVLVPLIAWGVWALWQKLVHGGKVSRKVGAIVASVIGTMANTVLCLGMILLVHGTELNDLINNLISAGNADAGYLNNAAAWLIAVVGIPNGASECVVAAIIVPTLQSAVEAVLRRMPKAQRRGNA